MTQQEIDVKALADLARLEVTPEEMVRLEKELPSILEFVRSIEKVSTEGVDDTPALRNVLRDDANPHESGVHTEILLQAAPKSRDGRVVVKQVISRKK